MRAFHIALLFSGCLLLASCSSTSTDPASDELIAGEIDTSLFVTASIVGEITEEECILSGGTETTCIRFSVNTTPVDHSAGPWCPGTIQDDASQGGIWPEGGVAYDVDGAFIENLDTFYDDDFWRMYDDAGNVRTTQTREACAAAANPNVGAEYANFCVQCETSYLEAEAQITYVIPKQPVMVSGTGRTSDPMGVAFNGISFAPAAPTANILGAYTLAPFDDCGGHVNLNVGYHYHEATGCGTQVDQTDGHAAMIGYALDGFPFYAQLNADGQEPTDLDACRGHTDDVRGYHYHVAAPGTNQFVGCFRGEYGCALEGAGSGQTCDATQNTGGPGGGPPRGPGRTRRTSAQRCDDGQRADKRGHGKSSSGTLARLPRTARPPLSRRRRERETASSARADRDLLATTFCTDPEHVSGRLTTSSTSTLMNISSFGRGTAAAALVVLALLPACDSNTANDDDGDSDGGAPTGVLAAAYAEFDTDNVTVMLDGSDVLIESNGYPNHTSPYWSNTTARTLDGRTTAAAATNHPLFAEPTSTSYDQMAPGNIDDFNGSYALTVPSSPSRASSSSATGLGAIGIAVSGAMIYNDQEGPNVPLANAVGSLDVNGAHTGPQSYHYHLEPVSFSEDDDALIGVMADGFFLYGRRDADGTYPSDLDESGGHTGTTPHNSASEYHYHIQNELYLDRYYILFPGDYQGTPSAIR